MRSRVRHVVLWNLMKSGAWLSVSEISHESGLGLGEVIGAIRGVKGQYAPEYSLLRLQLVSETVSKAPGERQQKTYKFTCKDPALLKYVERILARYRRGGEG